MSLKVYRAVSLGAPRNHHAIFVETGADGSGNILQVTGNIQNGMTFETKKGVCPSDSIEFLDLVFLGWVPKHGYEALEQTCRGNPPPKKQFDGPKRLFPEEPLRRCQEWTRETVEALISSRLLETEASGTMSRN